MNEKTTIALLLAVLCILPAQKAISAACKQAILDGDRIFVADCGDSTCGIYRVDPNQLTDLGLGSSLPDTISFEFQSFTVNPPATGTFDLGSGINSNYATCEQCVLIFQDYVAMTPQKKFFQTGGTITIDANTVPGVATEMGLTWSNVTLAEVTTDPSKVSTLVPNGDCYIIVADKVFANGFDGPA